MSCAKFQNPRQNNFPQDSLLSSRNAGNYSYNRTTSSTPPLLFSFHRTQNLFVMLRDTVRLYHFLNCLIIGKIVQMIV